MSLAKWLSSWLFAELRIGYANERELFDVANFSAVTTLRPPPLRSAQGQGDNAT